MNEKEQLFNEYKHLAEVTVHRMFSNPERIAQTNYLQLEDLYQYARIGLFEACKTYNDNSIGTFKNHAIRNMRWSVGRHLSRESMNRSIYKKTNYKRGKENKKVNILSMSSNPYGDCYDDTTYYDITSSDTQESVESMVHSKMSYNQILNLLTDQERELVSMKLNHKSYTDIANHYGVSKQAIGKKFKNIQNKVKRHLGVVTN